MTGAELFEALQGINVEIEPDHMLAGYRVRMSATIAGTTVNNERVYTEGPGLDVQFAQAALRHQFALLVQGTVDELSKSNGDRMPRPLGCTCHWEAGDSPCPVHPSEDDS